MSLQSKRELLVQTPPLYRVASHAHKTQILDEFVAAAGYARKYAIRLLTQPERTAKSLFCALQARDPGRYPDVQLRTLQRRVQLWRADALLRFNDQWLQQDALASLPRSSAWNSVRGFFPWRPISAPKPRSNRR